MQIELDQFNIKSTRFTIKSNTIILSLHVKAQPISRLKLFSNHFLKECLIDGRFSASHNLIYFVNFL